MTLYVLVLIIVSLATILALFKQRILQFISDGTPSNRRYSTGTHVVISGGSKGIGKSLAIKFAELGVHVTIIARDPEALREARIEIESRRKREWQKINVVALDLTKLGNMLAQNDNNSSGHSKVEQQKQEIIDQIMGDHDRCDILINCCGQSVAGRFDELTHDQFDYMMKVNYFSAVNLTKLLLPSMKSRSLSTSNASRLSLSNGHIVFVSSMAGLVSFFGFSAYSASKFALVGLAEALQMELKPFDIDVTIAFPPDTTTPGLEEENKTKPDLTKKISESGGSAYEPDVVAIQLIKDIEKRQFYSVVGKDNRLFLSLFNSLMPNQTVMAVLLESAYVGVAKLVAFFMCRSWHTMVANSRGSEQIRARLAMKTSKSSTHMN